MHEKGKNEDEAYMSYLRACDALSRKRMIYAAKDRVIFGQYLCRDLTVRMAIHTADGEKVLAIARFAEGIDPARKAVLYPLLCGLNLHLRWGCFDYDEETAGLCFRLCQPCEGGSPDDRVFDVFLETLFKTVDRYGPALAQAAIGKETRE